MHPGVARNESPGRGRAIVLVAALHIINTDVKYHDVGSPDFLNQIKPGRPARRLVNWLTQLATRSLGFLLISTQRGDIALSGLQ